MLLTATAKSFQSCPTLCDPINGSPPCSPIPGILQARTLEWVAISFCDAWKWKVKVKSLSRFRLLATPWTAAYQAPPSMGFSRQEYRSGVPLPSPNMLLKCFFFFFQFPLYFQPVHWLFLVTFITLIFCHYNMLSESPVEFSYWVTIKNEMCETSLKWVFISSLSS